MLNVKAVQAAFDRGENYAELLANYLVAAGVSIVYLAQIVIIFAQLETQSRQGRLGLPRTKDCPFYEQQEYLPYNRFYDATVEPQDFADCLQYFLERPEQLQTLFNKTGLTDLGFQGLLQYEEQAAKTEGAIAQWLPREEYFSFGYVLNNPFNMYGALAQRIPYFDQEGTILEWLEEAWRQAGLDDEAAKRTVLLEELDRALAGNSFYAKLVLAQELEDEQENFYVQGLYGLAFGGSLVPNPQPCWAAPAEEA